MSKILYIPNGEYLNFNNFADDGKTRTIIYENSMWYHNSSYKNTPEEIINCLILNDGVDEFKFKNNLPFDLVEEEFEITDT